MDGPSGDSDFPYFLDVTLRGTTQDFDALFGAGCRFSGAPAIAAIMRLRLSSGPPANIPAPVTVSLPAAGMGGMFAAPRRWKMCR
jgi:hypothetical protein